MFPTKIKFTGSVYSVEEKKADINSHNIFQAFVNTNVLIGLITDREILCS